MFGLESENSSDLSSGDSPQFKSGEFSDSNPIVTEIQAPQFFTFIRKVASFSEHDPKTCYFKGITEVVYTTKVVYLPVLITIRALAV